MKAVIQRVTEAEVTVGGESVGKIGRGLMILLGIETGDTEADGEWLVRKCGAMRIFDDEDGVMNRSVKDTDGDVMVVSQFTLAASIKKGNRPSYINAAGHDLAIPLYEKFCSDMERETGKRVARGIFGADMKVSLVNDGPVTIIADSRLR